MNEGTTSIIVRGEQLLLHPHRAVPWPRRKAVIVADTHFGKSSFFGRHGIAVPAGSDVEGRARLSRLLRGSQAEFLFVLGDFLHAPIALNSRDGLELESWARDLAPAQVIVIAGNHDRGAKPLSSILWRQGELLEPPFRLIHEAGPREEQDEHFTLSGHIHPVMKLRSSKRALRVPVFWHRPSGLALPSFGAFTGGYPVRAALGERLYAVGPDSVTPMPSPGPAA